MKTVLLWNPIPYYGEIADGDAWLNARDLASNDVEHRFTDLDGDTDPTIPDIGVRTQPAADAPQAESLILPRFVRGAWRALRDQAGGANPTREKRVRLLHLLLLAATRVRQGNDPSFVIQTGALQDIARDIDRRAAEAKRTVAGRPMVRRDIVLRGERLRVTHLNIGSGFEAREAFNEMPGIDLLIAHDARVRPSRTAIMARQTLDLTRLFDALYDRLYILEENTWEIVRQAKPGPSPMILPTRRLAVESRLAGNPNAMFDLIQECASA